ncbi:MAG: hypothetical protein K0Q73_2894 [Paenibacillus sp.]|jgi:hypothetical protein|nr:hypothetical protein [Paenibacillus sp.]
MVGILEAAITTIKSLTEEEKPRTPFRQSASHL